MTEYPVVLMICGHAGVGKDLFAKYVKDELMKTVPEDQILITHFADLIKYICTNFLGWNGKKDFYGRMILQYVGTDVFKAANPNYWSNFIIDLMMLFNGKWQYVIIPDTRFPDEIQNMKNEFKENVMPIRVYRTEIDGKLKYLTYLHESEKYIDECQTDMTIYNDGSKEHLKELAADFTKELIKFYNETHKTDENESEKESAGADNDI